MVPVYAIFGAGMGYVMGGAGVAIFTGIVVGLAAAAGAWFFLRSERRRP